MCIAISKPQGFTLTDETLQECWTRNPDGAGFMYVENKQLQIIKGLMTFEAFKLAYEPHREAACVLHFRIKTHGKTNEENTHPFLIDKGLGMVHNGILSTVDTTSDQTMSDTYHFTQTHLHRFRRDNKRFYLNPVYKTILESFIGYSKLIFMDNQGNVEIFNESKGVWDSGCWFSNTSYKTYEYPKQTRAKEKYNGYWDIKQRKWIDPKEKLPDLPKKLEPVKKSDGNPRVGDFCRTTAVVVSDNNEKISIDSYVKIIYFTTTHWVGVQEVLTGYKAELPLSNLIMIPRSEKQPNAVKPLDYFYDSEDLSLQTWQ